MLLPLMSFFFFRMSMFVRLFRSFFFVGLPFILLR